QSRVKRHSRHPVLPQLYGHVCRQLVGRGLRGAVRHVANALLRGPERNIDDQAVMLRDHRWCDELAGVIVGANAGAEHRIPPPQGLLPERLRPGELAVLNHPLVATPDVVHKKIDVAGFGENPAERRVNFGVHAMIAAERGAETVHVAKVLLRPAGRVHLRTCAGELARNASTDASAGAGHTGHFAVQWLHHATLRRWKWACIGKIELTDASAHSCWRSSAAFELF